MHISILRLCNCKGYVLQRARYTKKHRKLGALVTIDEVTFLTILTYSYYDKRLA